MWLRRAAALPWQVLGALTLLSVSVAVSPFKVLTSALKPKQQGQASPSIRRVAAMPKEYYDVQEVSAMLKMVRAAMQSTTEYAHSEQNKVAQLSQQVDELQESLENINHLFAQVTRNHLIAK